jgi:hypothetical protein
MRESPDAIASVGRVAVRGEAKLREFQQQPKVGAVAPERSDVTRIRPAGAPRRT